ncbi:hypothetical protein [Chitinophaga nivalis]|uniref:DUF4288 domain-containing protein n=1 Tax=Chitinophaga nivalis TaxID=2991709 RepID=A0ABT3IIJ2_9BACT|nr:hypothetical protein [Chitinophaga nivalis]MCW3466521.1 hypothetical protein [Chitinophaga nivalis]MCW3483788.1 hypothetical protein [Chitinophaga nivalis]
MSQLSVEVIGHILAPDGSLYVCWDYLGTPQPEAEMCAGEVVEVLQATGIVHDYFQEDDTYHILVEISCLDSIVLEWVEYQDFLTGHLLTKEHADNVLTKILTTKFIRV